jgi:hypothetical protein
MQHCARERMARVSALGVLILSVSSPAAPARAQSLRDTLKEHVAEGLEESKDKARDKDAGKHTDKAPPKTKDPAKKKAASPAPAAPTKTGAKPSEPKRGTGETLFSFDSERDPPPTADDLAKKDEPTLPVRVIGKDLKLDIEVGAGYRGWVPQQYDAVEVDIGSYFTWTIDVRAKLFGLVNIRRGYYESNGLAAPRTDEADTAARIGQFAPKAAWLLGAIGVPISKAWEPVVRYESRAFDTRATPRQDVCIVPRGADPDQLVDPADSTQCSTGTMRIVSGFETFVAGVRYDHGKEGSAVVTKRKSKFPPVFFGMGLMQYRKPYQLTIGTSTLDDYLFNGRFRGAGLALGTDLGGGIDQFFADVDMQLGLGEVSLLESLKLNDLAPDDWLIGYLQGTATIGYRWPMIRAAPTLILIPAVTGGGASFFFFETEPAQDEEGTTAAVNWDFLWAVRVSLLIPL